MGQSILEILKKALKREMVFLNGLMESYMMDNGLEERKMEVEFGRELMEILILENGKKEKFKGLEYLFQRKVIDMRANLGARRNMD